MTAKQPTKIVEPHILIEPPYSCMLALPVSLASQVLASAKYIKKDYDRDTGAYVYSADPTPVSTMTLSAEAFTAALVAERIKS